jgi:hypothetical protein
MLAQVGHARSVPTLLKNLPKLAQLSNGSAPARLIIRLLVMDVFLKPIKPP